MLKYIPEVIPCMVGKGLVRSPVLSIITHPAGNHPPKCPIREDWIAVEVICKDGVRWYGTKKAYIDSSLRMVIEVATRDEVLSKWEDAE